MATLLSNAKLGNTGVSGLLKSALTISNEINTYKDAQAAQDYALSAKTADDLAAYQNHLQDRIKTLNSTGSVTDATKALSLTNSLYSAIKANGSSDIQRENIQIMAGSATLQDKYQAISSQYVRAVGIGDMALAQSLESQAYSVSQTIQYQQQQAGEAALTLAKANASTDARVAGQMADNAIASLKQLNKDLSTVGTKQATSDINNWLNTKSPDYGGKTPLQAFSDLGINLPKGSKPNPADLAQGVAQYAYQQYAIAAKSVDPYLNPGQNNTFEDKANAIVTGQTKIPVVGGKTVSYTDLSALSNAINQGAVGYNETTGGYGKLKAADISVPDGSNFNGWRYDATTNSVQPILSNNGFLAASPDLAIQATALGLNTAAKTNKDNLSQGAAAQVTSNSPDWLKKVAPVGSYLNVALDGKGRLTFSATNTSNGVAGNSVFTVIKDATGKRALAESGSMGDKILAGEYGFNANNLPTSANGPGRVNGNPTSRGNSGSSFGLSNAEHNISNWFGPLANRIGSLFGGHASAQDLINGGEQTFQANAAAAAAMIPHNLPPLPNISIAPSPPQAAITQAPAGRTSQLVPLTVNPQRPTVNPQQPSGGNLQGGSINLQGGGGGIQL